MLHRSTAGGGSPSLAAPRRTLALLTVLVLVLGFLVTVARETTQPQPAQAAEEACSSNPYGCWMDRDAAFIGQRPLNQVVMPASHDTGTYTLKDDISLARNQNLNVFQQLAVGVRGLDLRGRPRTLNGSTDLYVFHGSVDTDVKLSTTLDDLYRYATSPGTAREIVYAKVKADTDAGGLTRNLCNAVQQKFGSLILTRDQVISPSGAFRSLNEIWSLPGQPRVIIDWDSCGGVSSYWAARSWSTNGDYYANQGNTPCVKYAVTKALESRLNANENGPNDFPFTYQNGNPCWTRQNVPAGSQPMAGWDRKVSGLYVTFAQQTGLVPSTALYVQSDVVTMLEDYWTRNVGTARGNLNYVSGDFVLDDPKGTQVKLVERTTGLNRRSVRPAVGVSYATNAAGGVDATYTCLVENGISGGRLDLFDPTDTASASTGWTRVDDATVRAAAAGRYVAHCTDGSGRKARLVTGGSLRNASPVTQTVVADTPTKLTRPAVTVIGSNGNPAAGVPVTFTVTAGKASLSPTGAQTATVTTGSDGVATTPFALPDAPTVGRVTVTATSPSAPGSQPFNYDVVPGSTATVSVVSGDGQSTQPGKAFAPLVVKVTDRFGNPAPGRTATFAVDSGPVGLPTASRSVMTQADGTATANPYALANGNGSAVVSATSNSVRATFDLDVVPFVQGPGPVPQPPSADVSVEVKGPKKVALGKKAVIKVSVVNAGPDEVEGWASLVAVGDGLTITDTSVSRATGHFVQLAGDDVIAADDTFDFTVTVRGVHRGQVGYSVLVGSDVNDPDQQNGSAVKVVKVT